MTWFFLFNSCKNQITHVSVSIIIRGYIGVIRRGSLNNEENYSSNGSFDSYGVFHTTSMPHTPYAEHISWLCMTSWKNFLNKNVLFLTKFRNHSFSWDLPEHTPTLVKKIARHWIGLNELLIQRKYASLCHGYLFSLSIYLCVSKYFQLCCVVHWNAYFIKIMYVGLCPSLQIPPWRLIAG